MKTLLRTIAITAICVAMANAQDASKKTAGPAVGETIENFILNDQFGKKRSLSELLKNGPIAIVFHRSADW